mmetsp:Transcript_9674/g.15882  ORF Transcript_9674/g.15882 Transcript_9674/m.15882 type:complete len:297 (+) Transcript_9674:198-1088(+)|eukprot:CAMPEP_0203745296 /NCGR_PEP_ID=MMETSP0098-20131031/1081_1 /ASSEMBLY_ACC=CAM_ASM_000208 /TAXON_ID=96639 /ORGANISM=" , Strain NY0313808BC1" /LENGTH=296 /DNA_ID=CAMNT_0050633037 /DNA_START=183 /DNA_END=1073 /DNA_ORIENTATION=+
MPATDRKLSKKFSPRVTRSVRKSRLNDEAKGDTQDELVGRVVEEDKPVVATSDKMEEDSESDDESVELKTNEQPNQAEEDESEEGENAKENGDGSDSESADDDDGAFFAKTLKDLVTGETEGREDKDGGVVTVLSKRKTKEMKEIEKHKREAKKQKLIAKEKRRARETGLIKPELSDIGFERQLRKIATRGVVVLFNAIQTHQAKDRSVAKEEKKEKPKKDLKEVSKNTFLDMLKKGGKKTNEDEGEDDKEEVQGKGWNALRDDFMVGAGVKDFEKEEEEEDQEEEEHGFDSGDEE